VEKEKQRHGLASFVQCEEVVRSLLQRQGPLSGSLYASTISSASHFGDQQMGWPAMSYMHVDDVRKTPAQVHLMRWSSEVWIAYLGVITLHNETSHSVVVVVDRVVRGSRRRQ
jgi:hypothetical protein